MKEKNQAQLTPWKIAEWVTCSQSLYITRLRHRSFDFTATSKLRQTRGHAKEEATTETIVTSLTSLPASSLPHKPHVTTAPIHWSHSPMPSSQDKAPKREYDTQAPPSSSHRSRVSPEEAEMVGSMREGCNNEAMVHPGR